MTIEEIVYEAWELGKRDELYNKVAELRKAHPRMHLTVIYEKAFDLVKWAKALLLALLYIW